MRQTRFDEKRMCNTARVWYINLRHTEIRYLMNNKTFNRNTDLHGMKRQVLIFFDLCEGHMHCDVKVLG